MKTMWVGFLAALLATPVVAQSQVVTASPIPDNAETRFCYYAGNAYSENAFILLVGRNTVTSSTQTQEERLLRCYREEDGRLTWRPQSTLQLTK